MTMPVLDNYLFFSGNCEEAMRFYERTLGGKLEAVMTYAQSPDPEHCPPGSDKLVMHTSLLLDGRRLMASDVPAGMGGGPKPMAGFALSLGYTSAAEGQRVFDALAKGGSVTMPMQKTFWAESFGMLTDRFGTPWMVSGGGMPT
jgi:PhnB protein